jgi:hypothetical protein
MNTFPDHLSDPETFTATLDHYLLQKMRKKVYRHILRNNQNDFFDIELFNRVHVNDMKKTESFSEKIIEELKPLGWKTFIGYGGTGLFFYDKELPTSAW